MSCIASSESAPGNVDFSLRKREKCGCDAAEMQA